MERCFFEFGPISKILAYLSHIDEYNLSATCSFLYSLIYTYRHWCINRYNCLSNKLNSYPRHFSYINYLILSKSSRIQIEYPDEESCLLSTSSCGYLKYSSVFGWGVYAKKTIPKHSIIHYYCGEMISTREMRNRYEDYDQQKLNYVLTIREHSPPNLILTTNIDATYVGNITRFINHSCDPNLFMIMHRSSRNSPLAVPYFISIRTIAPSEQLTFDYGSSEVEEEQISPLKKQKLESFEGSRSECYCGSARCRKWLPSAHM